MKKVFLFAYTQINLGDDLLIRAIVRRYSDARFYLFGEKCVAENFAEDKNLMVIPESNWLTKLAGRIRPSFAARLKNAHEQHCDSVVYIGGSLFIEYDNWETILNWWEYEAEHRKFYVLGANFGPWHTEEYRHRIGFIFDKMQDVCFRDKYSRNLFSEVETVRYAPDILLNYPMPKVEIKTQQAFISVINCASKDEGDNQLSEYDQAYTKGMIALIQILVEDGWRVALSSFCKNEGDEVGIQKILDGLKLKNSDAIEILNYDGKNTSKLLNKLAESEIIYGSRFHAVILGLAAHRPVVPIIYSNKTKNILKDLHFSGDCFDIRKLGESFADQAAALAYHPERQILSNVDQYAKQSEEHFQKLDQQLNHS